MAQVNPPSTGVDTGDPPTLDTPAVPSMPTQGAGASAPPLELSAGDPLLYNPWNFNLIAPGAMPIPSLKTSTLPNGTTTLPHHEGQQNGAHLAQFDIPTPQNPQQAVAMPQLGTEAVGADAATAEEKVEDSSDDLSDIQMSDGSESRVASESSDIDRQDKYAFNFHNQAYDHQVPRNLTGGITIFAKRVCMGTLIHQHLAKAKKQGDADTCPTLVPHELELQGNQMAAVECVWVGMLPALLQDGGDDSAESQPKIPNRGQKRAKKAQSLVDLEDDQLEVIPHNPKAFRVVAKVQPKQVKTWHLYALTTSDTGSKLCQGWKVPSDEVFFFKAFRDDAVPGPMKRRQATELKIKAKVFPMPPAPIPAVASQSATPSRPAASPASDPAGTPAKNEGGDDGPAANRQSPAEDPGAVGDDGSEDAYPEHAVPSSDPIFKGFLDNMLRELSVVEPEGESPGHKRKRVAFDTGGGDVANTRRKTNSGPQSSMQTRDGEDGGAEPSSFVIGERARHLALKLENMVNQLVEKQDVSGLHQCVTMMQCIQKRHAPGPTSALAPYLSTSSKKDADSQACTGKLREILDLFPKLREVDGLDHRVLACMIHGLRETGQSIEIGLVEACIKCYSRLFQEKYGDKPPANPGKMAASDVIDMICQARDDAEQMLRPTPLKKARVAHAWTDPRHSADPVCDE
ncbi:hypothetical protein KVR01_006808 [Diaporthe batatas]|uniref:uncharacterized protein n=1 Tax=Diaporthe batatas TaxID=748121 RepID=UPI001D059022|nr:uncharacterized protein KVR01_006808 [Diaporthe batatas]KAG8163511.1 hypothetical protein KVR01_006808 [Diaporthe batatas]